MGRRGGKKAAERWKADPHGEYALAERKKREPQTREDYYRSCGKF
ncbi:hypothetical protein [Corynebacterium silvaticum]|uniref:Uncharacterized protein n=1 Tax=Corynebacterium silvaticum TaxID=2320431 RepID=A0ACD4PZY3_9CORY|nr:hypothetical protein [Corynebacterium silvaticum]WCV10678.1 hypothetical protein CBE74_12065 [Corynebacterium silvaticum]